MPCRVELFHCKYCGGEHYYNEECQTDPSKYGEGLAGYDSKTAAVVGQKALDKRLKKFDTDGALCDVLSLLEEKGLLASAGVPQDILNWWEAHQSREKDKTKKEALAKLTAKEKRALGL